MGCVGAGDRRRRLALRTHPGHSARAGKVAAPPSPKFDRHCRHLGWIVVLVEFQVWKLLLPYHWLAVRMFTLYSLLLVVYATVSAAVYLRLIAEEQGNSSIRICDPTA